MEKGEFDRHQDAWVEVDRWVGRGEDDRWVERGEFDPKPCESVSENKF